ncbi:unnamed protein product, partial [Symbiodinium pilosum]
DRPWTRPANTTTLKRGPFRQGEGVATITQNQRPCAYIRATAHPCPPQLLRWHWSSQPRAPRARRSPGTDSQLGNRPRMHQRHRRAFPTNTYGRHQRLQHREADRHTAGQSGSEHPDHHPDHRRTTLPRFLRHPSEPVRHSRNNRPPLPDVRADRSTDQA